MNESLDLDTVSDLDISKPKKVIQFIDKNDISYPIFDDDFETMESDDEDDCCNCFFPPEKDKRTLSRTLSKGLGKSFESIRNLMVCIRVAN